MYFEVDVYFLKQKSLTHNIHRSVRDRGWLVGYFKVSMDVMGLAMEFLVFVLDKIWRSRG